MPVQEVARYVELSARRVQREGPDQPGEGVGEAGVIGGGKEDR